VKILHTADWHVGKTLRGRSRAAEHAAVLAEIAAVAEAQAVDLALVVGDVFDTGAPTPESESIAYQALLALAATGAQVVVVSGNHDNERRLQAVAPLLALGRVVTRASFASAGEGGVVRGVSRAGEPWQLAVVPFLSQRFVVRAADLLSGEAADHTGTYGERVGRIVAALCAGFCAESVNLVAAHLMVAGGMLGGGERTAQTIFDYAVSPAVFPPSAHYVALGHLHRAQVVPGACPIRYSGSPLALDFGETADAKSVTVVEAAPGRPAVAKEVALSSGRALGVAAGTLDELRLVAAGGPRDAWLKVVVREQPRVGLAEEVRELFPDAVDVAVDAPVPAGVGAAAAGERPSRAGRSPGELFAEYLAEGGRADADALVALFNGLMAEELEMASR